MYQLLGINAVLRLSDNICIQIDDGNVDYREYRAWIAEGNEPLPYVPPPVVAPPDWPALVAAIQTDPDFDAVWNASHSADPKTAIAMFVAFGTVATGGLPTFAPLFEGVCALGGATPAQRQAWAGVAEGYRAPADFVDAVRGTPAP